MSRMRSVAALSVAAFRSSPPDATSRALASSAPDGSAGNAVGTMGGGGSGAVATEDGEPDAAGATESALAVADDAVAARGTPLLVATEAFGETAPQADAIAPRTTATP